MEVFKKGYNVAFSGGKPLLTESQVAIFFQDYSVVLQMNIAHKNQEKCKKFLEENKRRSGVKVTASGLQYEIIKDGTGPVPTATDIVTVYYKGSLIDGSIFDSSYDRGKPAKFSMNGIIPGMTEALSLMKTGSKYKFYIPSELAYGTNPGSEKIKPNSALIFEIELLSVEKAKK